nr:MAG TPA: hypothetical protein [Caudoviricetes sp.]
MLEAVRRRYVGDYKRKEKGGEGVGRVITKLWAGDDKFWGELPTT